MKKNYQNDIGLSYSQYKSRGLEICNPHFTNTRIVTTVPTLSVSTDGSISKNMENFYESDLCFGYSQCK